MAENDKANVEVEVITNSELIPVETVNREGISQASTLLTKATEIEADDYEHYLAVAKKLKTYIPTISISSKYYEFTKPGESVRGVFLGTTTIKKKQDEEIIDIECIQWLGEDGNLYINGGVALVSTFLQFMPPKGCPIEITYESRRDRTKLYDVRFLTAG